jgi:predicted house-cleaning NTP pyrophosphatase (Maf/HAM1 superfamily)
MPDPMSTVDHSTGTELCPQLLQASRLAHDRRQPALDRRDGCRDPRPARQELLIRQRNERRPCRSPSSSHRPAPSARHALERRPGFRHRKRPIDERAIEASIEDSGLSPEEIATILAEAKAIEVSERHPGRLVIGCDQTLSLDERYCTSRRTWRRRGASAGAVGARPTELHSAVVAARDGEAVWRHVSTATDDDARLDPAFVGRHLARSAKRRCPRSAPIRSRAKAYSSSSGSKATTSPSSACPAAACWPSCGSRA